MKRVIILCAIMITSSILSSCAPIVQGAAAVTTVATMSNDRRTMGAHELKIEEVIIIAHKIITLFIVAPYCQLDKVK